MDLYNSIRYGNINAVFEYLKNRELNINKSITISEDTPLHVAIFYNQNKIARLLIDNGANIKKRNCHGISPLHLTCSVNNLFILKLLLTFNIDINIQDYYGWTPLHNACFYNNIQIIEELLNANADIAIKTIYNEDIYTLTLNEGKDFLRYYFLRKELLNLWEIN